MTLQISLKTLGVSALLAGTVALPAQAAGPNFIGNVIIDGSLCVGLDCVPGMAFGFDTIVMQENNLRLFFNDTSVAAAFPPNDWRLTANDSTNGGSSYFGVEDATAGRFVFRVFAGARSNALTVDSQGDVGLGTTTPALDIDIKTGDTPSIRLQQDGTSGFTPQSWDMAGNEAGFFIRDATSGSTLPLRIRVGAPTSALDIAASGDVGLGDTTPTADLDITRSGTRVLVEYETTGTATVWNLVMDADGTGTEGISFTRAGTGTREFRLTPAGDLTITGEITTSGSCSIGCDRVFDADYVLPSIEEHAALMWSRKHLPNVGPTAEEGMINVSDKVLRMLNELEQAHIYIDQLNTQLKEQEVEFSARLEKLEEGRTE